MGFSLGGLFSGASSGASMGSSFGPWGAVAGGVIGGVAGGFMGKSGGGGGSDTSGVQSAMNGSGNVNAFSGDQGAGGQWGQYMGMAQQGLGMAANIAAMFDRSKPGGGTGTPSPQEMGNNTREYLKAAFPEMNPWERAGAGASGAGVEAAGQNNSLKTTQMQLDNQTKIAQMSNNTAITMAQMNNDKDRAIAELNNNTSASNVGLQSSTSRANTRDTVAAQNKRVDSEIARNNADVAQAPSRIAANNASATASNASADASVASAANTREVTRGTKASNDAGNTVYTNPVVSGLNQAGTLGEHMIDRAKKSLFGTSKSDGVSGSIAPRKAKAVKLGQGPTYAYPGASSSR